MLGLVTYKVVKVTRTAIREKALQKAKNAFKLKIKDKSTKHVDVGIYSRNEDDLGDMRLEGNEVSSDIRKGQIIYLYD